MTTVVVVVVLVALVGLVVIGSRRAKETQARRAEAELEPVRKLADEDITQLGEELQELDLDTSTAQLDPGARSDYQRALDAYEAAKEAVPAMTKPDDVRHVTTIVEDGRYAMACVRARLAHEPLPTRRPPCFFDPRHGMSVTDVEWAPRGGAPREVPACALDAERVEAGAEPDVRQVMSGSQRVPYWQAGPAYQPYAMGYFGGFSPMNWMFTGMLFSSMMGGGWGGDGGYGEGYDAGYDAGSGDGGDGGGDGGGDAGGDGGGFDGGGGWGDAGGFGGDFGGDFGGGDFGGF